MVEQPITDYGDKIGDLLKSINQGEQEIVAQRKSLVDATKLMKRAADEEKAEANKELLKKFQLAVDFFTNQYKKANAEVQAALNGLPEALIKLLEESKRSEQLQAQNGELVQKVTNQEKAIRLADESLKQTREELEILKQAQENSSDLWMELEQVRAERDDFEARQEELQVAIAEANHQMTLVGEQKSTLEAELLKLKAALNQSDDRHGRLLEQKDREIEILMLRADTDRMNMAELVREKKALQVALETEQQQAKTRRPSAVDEAIRVKEESISRMLEEAKAEVSRLQTKLQERDVRLASMSDYEALKHQLSKAGSKIEANADVEGKLIQAEAIVKQLEAVNSEQREAMQHLSQRVNDLEGMLRQFDSLSTGCSLAISPSSPQDRENLLAIINNQRERLRKRNEELDEKVLELNQLSTMQRNELTRAQADNLKLLEKIKHLESIAYKKPNFTDVRRLSDVEAGVQQAEKDDQFFDSLLGERLSRQIQTLLEKYPPSWSYARIFMTGRMQRRLFLAYVVGLHFLIMYVLIKVS